MLQKLRGNFGGNLGEKLVKLGSEISSDYLQMSFKQHSQEIFLKGILCSQRK